jgi:hypothetical protein
MTSGRKGNLQKDTRLREGIHGKFSIRRQKRTKKQHTSRWPLRCNIEEGTHVVSRSHDMEPLLINVKLRSRPSFGGVMSKPYVSFEALSIT